MATVPKLSIPSWLRVPSWRILSVIAGAVVLLAGAALGGWFWLAAREHRDLASFADAMLKVQMSQAPNAAPDAKAAAIRELEAALARQPSGPVTAQVTYELGNLKYQAQQYAASRTAYEVASGAKSTTLSRLSQVNVGYAWEAQKEYGKAIETFQKAVAPLKPGEFLYDELLVDLGRVQELAGKKEDAIKTYRRILSNPATRRSDDVRARLAGLGVKP
jgi:tetratricopeptide (TPR) repeat protein